MQSIRYVSKVVPSKFILNDKFLNKFKINLLIHGQDNKNKINKKFLLIVKRTKNISSAILRKRAVKCLRQMN
jgi:glycerol-3-phosphate cytidylyltransferase-like family protein